LTGREFRKLRLRLGLTQETLGKRMGVRANTVYRWESGRLPVPRMAALAIKAILLEEGIKGQAGR
jgi:transcriptional regulator with XRE-family HTH domain